MQIEIDGINVNYIFKDRGTKTNVIFLHGWGANIESFTPAIANLESTFNVYAIDFPGFGKSKNPPTTYDVGAYAKLVLEFINRNKLENVVLIGHSFGGRVIIKMVGDFGYKPKKIILVDSAGIKPKKKFSRKVKERTYKILKSIIRVILGKKKSEQTINKLRSKMGSSDYVNADDTMKEVFKLTINEDLTQYLPNIKVPTLLVWGELDTETPLSDGKKMEELIPDAGLVIIPGGGHFSYLNNIVLFNTVVNKFLEGCD